MCVPIWCGRRKRLMSIRYGKHGLQCLIRQILPEGFVWFFPNSVYPTHNRHVRGGRSASTPVHWGDALMIGKQLSQSCTSVCCKTDVLSPDKICICFQVARQRMSDWLSLCSEEVNAFISCPEFSCQTTMHTEIFWNSMAKRHMMGAIEQVSIMFNQHCAGKMYVCSGITWMF